MSTTTEPDFERETLMEMVVMATSTIRALLVALFLGLNFNALVLLCAQRRHLCVHQLTRGAVYLGNLFYLCTWLPFVTYGLLNGHTLVVTPRTYCLLQNFATGALGMVLLGLLAVRALDIVRSKVTPHRQLSSLQATLVLAAVWLLPQLVSNAIVFVASHVHEPPSSLRFHFLDDLTRLRSTDTSVEYRVGFLICEQELNPLAIHEYLWQYVYVVLPLALVTLASSFVIMGYKWRKKCWSSRQATLPRIKTLHFTTGAARCSWWECERCLVVVDLILCTNFAWHVFIRPLMVMHAMRFVDFLSSPAFFLDFGSHLVLTLAAVFTPVTATSSSSDGSKISCSISSSSSSLLRQRGAEKTTYYICLAPVTATRTEYKTMPSSNRAETEKTDDDASSKLLHV